MNSVILEGKPEGSSESSPKSTSFWRSALEFVLELVKVTVICAVIIIMVRWLLFQPFYVKGSSMEPSYFDGEYLIIYQLPFRFPEYFHKYQAEDRGISIIFHPPSDPGEFYIKRLIGLPGERVRIADGQVYIYTSQNPGGIMLTENYLGANVETLDGNYNDIQLGLDEIYVLGDNREHSLDSRRLGPIPITNVIGQPMFRGWPWERFGVIRKPTY